MMNPSVMNLQHRFVLELSVRLPFDQRQAPWRSLIILAAATSIISAILPITSAEPALFGVYVDDILLRWRDRLGHFDLCRVDLVFRTSQAYLLARLPLYCSAECAAPSNTSLLANFPRNLANALLPRESFRNCFVCATHARSHFFP